MTADADIEVLPPARIRAVNEVQEFTTAEKTDAKETVRFKMDGDLYTLRKPKLSIALTMLRLMEGEDARTMEELGLDLMRLVSGIIAYIERENPDKDGNLRGQAKLMHRLTDVDDDLDVTDLYEPFQSLIAQAFNRPTKSRPASGAKPRSTRRASGAVSRGARAKTSSR